MKKVLGLDLGSSSIGWALIHEPENENETYKIAGMGVRIIPLTTDENNEFSKGNAISKNASRTLKRGIRRGNHRYKLRRQELAKVLAIVNMVPEKNLFSITALELYALRDKATREKIGLNEIGRLLLHFNQKRGYKSNRKSVNEEEKATNTEPEAESKKTNKKGYLDLIADREQAIEIENITIGQYYYQNLRKNPLFRIKENIFMRQSYIKEFNLIWQKQKEFYPEILTDELQRKIRDEIIYFQRPLKSQKGLISVCEFEGKNYKDKRKNYEKEVFSGPKVTPKSSPLFQVSKIWQELNNIEITSFKVIKNRKESTLYEENGFDPFGNRELTLGEKRQLFQALNWGDKLTPKQVLQFLGYKTGWDQYRINLRNEKYLEGNRTLSAIKKVFDKHKLERNDLLKFDLENSQDGWVNPVTGEIYPILSKSFETEPLYKLWHLIYSVEETDDLVRLLVTQFQLPDAVALDLARLDFTGSGYGNMSARALRKITPHLMAGMGYSKACESAGYNHSNSITTEENDARALLDKLELYQKNSLRQPVVEKIINQLINLVNDLIDEKNGFVSKEDRNSGKFEIRVELARDLRQNAKERNEAYKRNSEQDRKHKAIIEKLAPMLGAVSKRDIERYKLWEEFGGFSPYEPTKAIGLTELFNKKDGVWYDIEHIIPKSKLFDDSFTNKTICPRHLNSGTNGKNNNTAYDFMKMRGEDTFNNYIEFIKLNLNKKGGISKGKFNKLMIQADKIPDDFINRQMQETRFISKEVKNLLSQICRNVYTSTGSVTSKLRNVWGWDDVLMNLHIEKYRSVGKTFIKEVISNGQAHKIERIEGWSKRDDHRHHSIDALVVACTKQSFIQRMNTLNSEHTKQEMFSEVNRSMYKEKLSLLEKYLIYRRPFESAQVEAAVQTVLISFKPGKKVASKSINKIKTKNGEVLQNTLTPRGQLHKETVYGQIKRFEKAKLNTRFSLSVKIVDPQQEKEVHEHLAKFSNDPSKAFSSKELAKFIDHYGYNEVTIFGLKNVVRKALNKDFKPEYIEDIVDQKIKALVKERLGAFGNDPKKAFENLSLNPIWLNNEKGVFIKSVRKFDRADNVVALHTNDQGERVDFVSTSNNHHIALYLDENNEIQGNAVSFWDAFERKKAGFPVIIKNPKVTWDKIIVSGFDDQAVLEMLPKDGWKFLASLQQNEMFVHGLSLEELKLAISKENNQLISNYLYRIQNIAPKQFFLRHHIETKDERDAIARKLGKLVQLSANSFNAIKVTIDRVGRIKLSEESSMDIAVGQYVIPKSV